MDQWRIKIFLKIILDKPKIYPHLSPKGVPLCIVNSIEKRKEFPKIPLIVLWGGSHATVSVESKERTTGWSEVSPSTFTWIPTNSHAGLQGKPSFCCAILPALQMAF